MNWQETKIRVRYAETDKMGIVHHSNYYVWFELGRSDYCRARGFSYLEMEERNENYMIVAESYCRYKAPAFYEDILIIRSNIASIRSRSIQFVYQVFRPADNKLIAEGETLHFITDKNKRVRSIPPYYRDKLLSDVVAVQEAFPADEAPS